MQFTDMNTLNYEQYSWIMKLSQDESELMISLMNTGKWHLTWREEEHQFVFVRVELDEEE